MEQNDKLVLVYTTFPDQGAAQTVGAGLVKARLAGCVNIIPGMTSIYEWEGQLHHDAEVVAIIKTRAGLAAAVMDAVKAAHSYENPALLVLPIDAAAPDYTAWLRAQTKAADR